MSARPALALFVVPDLIRDPCWLATSVLRSFGVHQQAGGCPAATHFLLRRQKKVSKEKATLLSASLRFAAGNLRCSVQPGSRSNSPSAQTIASPDPSGPALLGAYRRVVGSGAGAGAHSQSGSGENALCASSPPRIRVGFLSSHPSGWAEERSRKRIRASDCLSAASSSSTPFSASTAGCPAAQRRGPGPSGRLFFGDFLLATQKKVTCRRATPGQLNRLIQGCSSLKHIFLEQKTPPALMWRAQAAIYLIAPRSLGR
jgi:hypothetical protein